MSSTTATAPLRDRDVNAQPETTQVSGKDLFKKHEGEYKPSYISPSDAIMSPASKKLSDFKQKQIGKPSGARRSLFAKAVSGARAKDLSSSSSTAGAQ